MRTLRNDFTIAHNGKLYRIESSVRAKEVAVEERVGSMLITLSGVRLEFRQITERPQKEQKPACKPRHRKGHTPSVDHPRNKWNGRLFRQMRGQHKRPMAAVT
jgi:hypothetical protein